MVNENCLEGIRCPDCGNEAAFYIQSSAVMHVTDDGAECRSDIEWDGEPYPLPFVRKGWHARGL